MRLFKRRQAPTPPPAPPAPRLAHVIYVDEVDYSLRIDGEEFPYYVADGGINVEYTAGDMPIVTIKVLTEALVVRSVFG